MRAFIAVDFPREIINELVSLQSKIKKFEKEELIKAKYIEQENLHLTLKFLGEISEQELEKINEKLGEIKMKKFSAKLGEIGVFSEDYIKIVWIKLEGDGIFQLQKEIDKALEDLFEKEHRFMSHITIARPKAVSDRKKFISELNKIKVDGKEFFVDNFSLKKSELMSEGAKHSEIKKYELID